MISDPSTCRDHLDAIVAAGRLQPRPAVTPPLNRQDPAHLATWREDYERIFRGFLAGGTSMSMAIDLLKRLGFKSDALKIEVSELIKAQREIRGPALLQTTQ